jgi:hypothetical protein
MSLTGGSVRRVRREVRLAILDVWGVPVRLMTMGNESVDFSTRAVLANGIGEGGIFVANHVCGVGEVAVIAIFPFPYLNLFDRGVSSACACVPDESRLEEPDEVGFECRGSQHRGEYLVREDGMA